MCSSLSDHYGSTRQANQCLALPQALLVWALRKHTEANNLKHITNVNDDENNAEIITEIQLSNLQFILKDFLHKTLANVHSHVLSYLQWLLNLIYSIKLLTRW